MRLALSRAGSMSSEDHSDAREGGTFRASCSDGQELTKMKTLRNIRMEFTPKDGYLESKGESRGIHDPSERRCGAERCEKP